MSTPRTRSRRPSRPSSSTTVSPIGLGRRGERVAKTPCGRSSVGGTPSSSHRSERSKTQTTNRCEKPSMSVSPGSRSASISRTPSALCSAPGPLGIWAVVENGLRTTPIERMAWSLIPVSLQYTGQRGDPMPQLGALAAYHPQVVHFVVALAVVGVLLRLVSLTGRLAWTGPAAATLILLAAAASVAAVQSGRDAHGPAERVPGARDAVVEHETSGEWARNALLALAAV